MSERRAGKSKKAKGTNEEDRWAEWERWAEEHSPEITLRHLPWEPKPWQEGFEEPLNLAAVFEALAAIRRGKSYEFKPLSRQPFPGNPFHRDNKEEVDHPPYRAVRIITRALQAGDKGVRLIKQALALKHTAKGVILARHIAHDLTKPVGGWPKKGENFDWEAAKWDRPSKQEVEREFERLYPAIYEHVSQKDGSGGKRLRPEFWEDAGLQGVLGQSRGNQ